MSVWILDTGLCYPATDRSSWRNSELSHSWSSFLFSGYWLWPQWIQELTVLWPRKTLTWELIRWWDTKTTSFTTYREAEDQSHCLGSKRGRATTPHCPPQGQAREWSAGPLQIWGPRKRWPSWVCWSLIPSWDHTCLPSFLGFPQHGQGTHPKSIENTASLRWCHLTLIAIFSTLKSSFLQARKHRFKEVTPKVIKRISETKTRLSHFRVRALDLCARLPPKNQLQLVFV